ncbi:MAG TPA: ABC transporter ATP-binding protein, partial [Candidatus Sulfotelmatobacter sp.]|nr:ABC transporter ATP-binding protein [Candidatus Sulfotelmatobacter sp.]
GAPVNGLMVGTGYMFQSDGLLPWKTVSDNIALPLRLQKRAPAEIRDRVDDWLRRTGLTRFASAYPSQLSGGMRKRAALAQALVSHPDVVLMDEPLSALDVQTRSLIGNELMTLWSKVGNTMVLVTHDLEEAIGMADEVVVLSSRPARVKAVYPIDLPRPRDLSEIRVTESYQRLYAAIWRDLREEVLRAHVEQN